MSVVNIEGGRITGITEFGLDGSNGLVEHILKGQIRTATETLKGSSSDYPSTYEYGEATELRINCNFTASQFQGLFMQVAMASGVDNTSTLRGMEVDARNASGQNVGGDLTGVHATASVKGAGTIGKAFGLHAQVSQDSEAASTVTTLAAIWAKVVVEDASTITNGYGVLISSEFVTGGIALTAAIGVESSGAGAFTSLIDATGAQLVETDSGKDVVLIKFQGANGTTYYLVHKTDAATVTSVVTSL